MPDKPLQETTSSGPALVCWICGYNSEERREEVRAGECRIAQEWGKKPERCLMNGPEEVARAERSK